MASVLAVDLGGSALKACLFDAAGQARASARVALAFSEPQKGWSEADPISWWDALCTAVETLSRHEAATISDVAMIAICGFTRTQVLLDRDGRPVRPAIGFRDRRAGNYAERMQARAGDGYADTWQLNAFHPLARLMWLKDNEPENWKRVHTVIEPKDYLNLRLTGSTMSDEVSLYWLARAFAGGTGSLASRCGMGGAPLPALGRPLDVVGKVQSGLPGALACLQGAKVIVGSNDTWMAAAGMDALVPGRAYCVSGSSEVFGLLSNREAHAPGLVTVHWGSDLWHLGGPGQNGANTLDWLTGAIGAGNGQATHERGYSGAEGGHPSPLVFLPFLLGERTPFWDSDLRAAMLGIDASVSAADLRQALMQGVAFVNRTVLERAETATGLQASEVRIGGGGSRDAVWNQIRADVLGRPLVVSPAKETGLAGCLAAARVALGEHDELSAAATSTLEQFERYVPDPDLRHYCDELYDIFRQAHEAVAPVSRRLADLARRPGAPCTKPAN